MIQVPLPPNIENKQLSSNSSFSAFSNHNTLAILDKTCCHCICIPAHYRLTEMKGYEPDYHKVVFDIKQTKLCCKPTYHIFEKNSSKKLAKMEFNKGCFYCSDSEIVIKDNENKYLGSSVYPGCQLCDIGVWVNNSNKEHKYWMGTNCCVCCSECCCCCFTCCCFTCKCCPTLYYSVPIWDGKKKQFLSNLDMAKTWLKYTFGCCGNFFMVLNYPNGASEIDKLNTTTGAIMYYEFVGVAPTKQFNKTYIN